MASTMHGCTQLINIVYSRSILRSTYSVNPIGDTLLHAVRCTMLGFTLHASGRSNWGHSANIITGHTFIVKSIGKDEMRHKTHTAHWVAFKHGVHRVTLFTLVWREVNDIFLKHMAYTTIQHNWFTLFEVGQY